MSKIRKVPYQTLLNRRYLNYYDLIIIPCNYMMEPIDIGFTNIIEKANVKKLNNYLVKKYDLRKNHPINDGDIRITPGFDIKPNLLFVKYPFRGKNVGIKKYLDVFYDMIDKIKINEYKKVLIQGQNNAYWYCFSSSETIKIDRIIHNVIEGRNPRYKKNKSSLEGIQFDEISFD